MQGKNPTANPGVIGRRKGGFRKAVTRGVGAARPAAAPVAGLRAAGVGPAISAGGQGVDDESALVPMTRPRLKRPTRTIKAGLRGAQSGMLSSKLKGVKF